MLPTRSLPRTLVVNLAVALCSIVLTLVVLECGYRVFLSYSPGPTVWNDRPKQYYLPESSVNLQDAGYAAIKPKDTFRIAVVGDSFSFGPYLQYDDTFVKRLERWLNLNSQRVRVEVINYGIPSYSTTHEVALVERAIADRADLILLQVTLNDPEVKPYRPDVAVVDLASGAVKLQAPIFKYWKSGAFVITRILNTQTHREFKEYYFRLFKDWKGWSRVVHSLGEMANMSRAAKVPMVAVVFPLFALPVDDAYPFFPLHKKFVKQLRDFDIPTLDLAPSFRDLPVERMQVIPVADRHPNEIAHRIAAEAIIEWFRRRKFVPEESLPRKAVPKRIAPYLAE